MTHHLIHHHTQSGYQLFLNALRHHSHSHPLAFRQLSGIHTSSTSSPAPRWTLRSRTHHPTLIASTAALVLGGGYYAYLNLEHESGFLHPNHYSPCLLRSVERLSDDTSLFHVSVPVTQVPIPPHPLYIESVYVKHPDLQIERPYTPLDGIRRDGEAKTSLLIKRYSDGELSNYIHQQRPLELRGPCLSWIHPTGRVKEIVFIAGGTGLTPAIQLLRRLYHDEACRKGRPRFKLVYVSRTPTSVYLRDELLSLTKRFPGSVEVRMVVDKLQSSDHDSLQLSFDKIGMLELTDLQRWVGEPEEGQIVLVSGPEGLIQAVAGPRSADMRSQGEIGGMLKALGYNHEQVHKL